MKQGTYLNLLYTIEQQLPQLLKDSTIWETVYVNYSQPYVERVYTNYLGLRICLHRITTCDTGTALFHPHPWPSAMRIVAGAYEMNVGYGSGTDIPPTAATILLPAGSAYEMINSDGWHSVRPTTPFSLSLMISGKPWDRVTPKSNYQLSPLSMETKMEILNAFGRMYP
jgi:hypothetical protein